jgi:carboxypeptidase C (cathepsin A)
MADNLYAMLQSLAKKYPTWFKNRDFYIFGESYGGHYVPTIANRVLNENAKAWWSGNYELPLKGIAIGDGWTDPYNQLGNYHKFGYAVGILDEKEAAVIEAAEKEGRDNIWWHDWLKARDNFDSVSIGGQQYAAGINMYNYREYGPYDTSLYANYLNTDAMKTLLHVPLEVEYKDCNNDAYNALGSDFMQSVKDNFENILAHIPVLLYNGQDDWIVNTATAENWIANLEWDGRADYLKAPKTSWKNADGDIIGYHRSYKNLHQLVVNKAGHMAPRDAPASCLQMVQTFIEKKSWN